MEIGLGNKDPGNVFDQFKKPFKVKGNEKQ